MHYRLVMAIQVENLPQIKAVRAALLPFVTHNVPIHPGEDNEEPGFIQLEKCYHDEDPTAPCTLLFRWDGIRGVTLPDQE